MKHELQLHRLTFGILSFMLVGFVICLLRIRSGLADEHLEIIASLAIVILAAAVFTVMGIIEETIAFQFGVKHKRELVSYLALGSMSLASGLYLAISEEASPQTIAVVAAPYALLFGIAELRIAQHLERHPLYRQGLRLSGVIETALGIALIVGSRRSNKEVAMLLGYVAILSVLQLLPMLFYPRNM